MGASHSASQQKASVRPFVDLAESHKREFEAAVGVAPRNATASQIALWILESGRISAISTLGPE